MEFSHSRLITSRDIHRLGALATAFYLCLAWLSRAGSPPPLPIFLLVVGGGWACALGAWRSLERAGASPPLAPVLIWAVVFRLVGLAAAPVYENDFYRYLWDGWVFLNSGNPYGKAPVERFSDPTVPDRLQVILGYVNHPDVSTIYSPVCQYVFALGAWIRPGSLPILKLLLLASELAALGMMSSLCPPGRLALYAWCPLPIIEVAFNAHSEILGVTALVATLYFHRRERGLAVGAFGALAVGAKILAVPAIPFLLRRAGRAGVTVFAAGLAVLYLPFLAQGSAAEWMGLKVFAERWEFNSSLYGLLRLALPNPGARAVSLALFAAAYAFLFVRWLRERPESPGPLDVVFGFLFLAAPVVNPWYLLWLLPFAALRPRIWSVTALGIVTLSYVTGQTLGSTALSPYEHPTWLRPIEYGTIMLALALDLLRRRKSRGLRRPAYGPYGSFPAPTGESGSSGSRRDRPSGSG